jgi:GTPase SAR1 family protein
LEKYYKNNEITCPICRKNNKERLEEIPVNKCVIELIEKELINNTSYLNNVIITDNKEFDFEFSIGIMGESFVGKTSITHYFYKGEPCKNPASTLGLEFHFKYLLINGKKIKIRLWDTAGQECYRSYAAGILRGVHAALCVFSLAIPYHESPEENVDKDVNRLYYEWKEADDDKKKLIEQKLTRQTFNEIESWLNQYNDFNQESNKLVYLIGNKVDDIEKRIIREDDIKSFSQKVSLKYFLSSALTGENINEIFRELCLDLMQRPSVNRSSLTLNKKTEKNKGQCKC